MKRSGLTLATYVLLLLVSFAVGRSTAGIQLVGNSAADVFVTPSVTATPTFDLPEYDAPGADLVDLPRYPDAVRVEYRQALQNDILVTEVEYVASAELQMLHDFYRDVFHTQGWTIADLNFYQGEWTFFVLSGSREALVEIEARGPFVEVEIELSEPQSFPVSATQAPSATIEPTATLSVEPTATVQPTSPPAPPTSVPAPPGGNDDGGDDDDGDDDDGDDGGDD